MSSWSNQQNVFVDCNVFVVASGFYAIFPKWKETVAWDKLSAWCVSKTLRFHMQKIIALARFGFNSETKMNLYMIEKRKM